MKRKYIYALSAVLLWGAVGCNKPKDFGGTNLDPSAVNVPLVNALLTNAENAVTSYASTGTTAISGAQYSQYFSETQYTTASLYAIPQNDFTGAYSGVLFDLQTIINTPTATKSQKAVAKILQQYVFWVLTDSWGDIPYSDALKGVEVITPKYDKQEDIYKGILATLASASAELDNSGITGDIIYSGSIAKWKLAANSLRMLVSIQLSKKVPASSGYAATDFKAAMSAGYINSNADNFAVTYPGGIYKSRWWSLYDGRKDYGESEIMTETLKDLNDARIVSYGGASEAAGNTETSDIGVPYGYTRAVTTTFTDANPKWARVLRGSFRLENGVVNIITAAEVNLAIAEAVNIGWVAGSAQDFYNAGITLSHAQFNVTVPANYLTAGAGSLTGLTGQDALDRITLQRWIASYPDGHMGWNIWRKSTPVALVPATPTVAYGVPALLPAPNATNTSKQIVRRFTYAVSEATNNGVNNAEAVKRIPANTRPAVAAGTDSQDARVWWDQN
ncbi:SusD/RagB family nutrient-binding outer membrane lipoprotein [Mucilaginibacter phyllosphaerae]|uniref:SusD/RagB family nutrient-binding outer membrane lipoprotein n=1 Tax=Mucilaginibacter phyllosphaerae TaxID=1812349 RepID=A0A4Y8ACT7_9SPHI|nr:SusD/RagB family nutrient-binding outer membrane lipoprotein [Mucilaginibacter phyllosphaerae]MBB3970065.1 hypothetical protein [Mucilaginibacter phyllosphaerae]TEW66457.1 SusD/RagB family nutrient-binding outer membrane lipoprotein [Mucilaginibacter phyllosphaerae]GGH09549.1 hypothetical protein GCM10007352_14980 [Mucilaginibacter phyllosphaerae]